MPDEFEAMCIWTWIRVTSNVNVVVYNNDRFTFLLCSSTNSWMPCKTIFFVYMYETMQFLLIFTDCIVFQISANRTMGHRIVILLLVILTVTLACAVVPDYLPTEDAGLTKVDFIKQYFYAGFKYAEITLLLLCRHKIRISVRHLKRIF